MSQTQTKLLSSVPAISSLAEGDKITVVTAAGQTALVSLSDLLATVKVGGRNLLQDANHDLSSNSGSVIGAYLLGNSKANKGEWYTLTICYTLGNGGLISCSLTGGNIYEGFAFAESGTRIVRSSSLYLGALTPASVNPDGALSFFRRNADSSYPATVHWAVLTKGKNVGVSDWYPAPEDFSGGGINPSFSEVSARISKKGGLHEYIDNYADEGSHQQGAEGDTYGCVGGKRNSRRRGRDNNSGSLLYQSDNRKYATGTGFLWHPYSRKNRRPNGSTRLVMAGWPSNPAAHEVQHHYAALESDNHNAYLVAIGKEVAA